MWLHSYNTTQISVSPKWNTNTAKSRPSFPLVQIKGTKLMQSDKDSLKHLFSHRKRKGERNGDEDIFRFGMDMRGGCISNWMFGNWDGTQSFLRMENGRTPINIFPPKIVPNLPDNPLHVLPPLECCPASGDMELLKIVLYGWTSWIKANRTVRTLNKCSSSKKRNQTPENNHNTKGATAVSKLKNERSVRLPSFWREYNTPAVNFVSRLCLNLTRSSP